MKYTKLITLAGSLLAVASAQGADWTGGDGAYETATNWSDGLAPAANSTQNINTEVTVDRFADSTAGFTTVSGGAILNITGGNQTDGQSGASIRNTVGSGSAGTVNQSGGTYAIGHQLAIGGNGAYNLTGGDLNVFRGSNSFIDTSQGRPSLDVGDASGTGSGLFEISGGSLITRFGAGIGSNGTFSVVGSGATSISIGNNTNGNGTWLQQSGGTLKATIDLGGLDTIFIDELSGSTAIAEFKSGSILDLSFNVAPYEGTWTVLELENQDILDSGLLLSAATLAEPNWSFAIDNSGANGILTATFAIPEPSTSLLAGSALLLGLGFRRRKA